MKNNPIKTPKPFVFVLMPFGESCRKIYEVGIKPACNDAGAYCERVDKQIFHESTIERIYNQISKADIVVSDMTGRNANVFYETGYAHALGKRVLLLSQKSEDIPFDLKHYPHIIYSGKIADLKKQLQEKISYCIQNPETTLEDLEFGLQFYIDKHRIEENSTLTCKLDTGEFRLNIYNPTLRIYEQGFEEIGIISREEELFPVDKEKSILLPSGEYLHQLKQRGELYPGAWDSLHGGYLSKKETDIIVRVFTKTGTRNFPARLLFPDGYEETIESNIENELKE